MPKLGWRPRKQETAGLGAQKGRQTHRGCFRLLQGGISRKEVNLELSKRSEAEAA